MPRHFRLRSLVSEEPSGSAGGASIARSNWSASSTVILPCASRSRMRRVSSLMVPFFLRLFFAFQSREHVADADLTAFETAEQIARLWGRVCRLDFRERQAT